MLLYKCSRKISNTRVLYNDIPTNYRSRLISLCLFSITERVTNITGEIFTKKKKNRYLYQLYLSILLTFDVCIQFTKGAKSKKNSNEKSFGKT